MAALLTVLSLSLAVAGILTIALRFVLYYEAQERFNPHSEKYVQRAVKNEKTGVYDIKIYRRINTGYKKSPVSQTALHRMG